MVGDSEIIRKFIAGDMHVTPEALDILRGRDDFEEAADKLMGKFRAMPEKPSVITEAMIREALDVEDSQLIKTETSELVSEETTEPTIEGTVEGEKHPMAEIAPQIEILQDVTGHSTSEGTLENFVNMFNDRYTRLNKILRERIDFKEAIPIEQAASREDEYVKIIGMVIDKRETSKRDLIIDLEDPTGRVALFIHKSRHELVKKASEVVTDEVIGVEAKVGKSGKSNWSSAFLFPSDITWPDIPIPTKDREEEDDTDPVYVALISDLHVGSEMFLEGAFMKFLRWLRGEAGNPKQRQLADRVKYLVIAGDLVDGIGVYPRQEEELIIRDVYKQYVAVAEYLSHVPDHVEIILSPGNHDAVRQLEPQPALPKDIASIFGSLEPTLIGSPAYVQLHGKKLLVYHGRGFDNLISADPTLDRSDAAKPMVKALQKRHLSPIYGEPMGGRAPHAPEDKDYLLIEEVPDVLHCGHLHVYGCGRYRGVTVVNSATFQAQTNYMRKRGVKPTPGIVPILDLKTKNVQKLKFA